jgi:tRNA nucleotidyltransferase (CCA-adding enzyme)
MKTKILTYITDWQYVTQKTTGYDLEARRLPPGPIYKEILTRLRNAWLDGEVLTTEDESALLENLMGEISDR